MKRVLLGFMADAPQVAPMLNPKRDPEGLQDLGQLQAADRRRRGSQWSAWHWQEGSGKAWSTDHTEKTRFFFKMVSQTKMSFRIHIKKKMLRSRRCLSCNKDPLIFLFFFLMLCENGTSPVSHTQEPENPEHPRSRFSFSFLIEKKKSYV